MNEEALIDAYNLFKRNGYGDSIEDFKVLISKNPQALKDSYSLFVGNGYGDSIEDYKKLLGVGAAPVVKKKSALDSSSEAGSLVSQESTRLAPQVDGEPPVKPMQKLTKEVFGKAMAEAPKTEQERFVKEFEQRPDVQKAKMFLEKRKAEKQTYSDLYDFDESVRQDPNKSEFLNNKLSYIDINLLNDSEEYVVEKLRREFKDLGFKFEETGFGDKIKIIAPNKKEQIISLGGYSRDTESSKNFTESSLASIKDWIKINSSPKDIFIAEQISKTTPQQQASSEENYIKGAAGLFLKELDDIIPIGLGNFADQIVRAYDSGDRQAIYDKESFELGRKGPNATYEDIQEYLNAKKNADEIPPSKEMLNYQRIYENEGKSFWGFVKGISKYPSVIGELIVNSGVRLAKNENAINAGLGVIGTASLYGGSTAGPVGAAAAGLSSVPYAYGTASAVLEMGSTFGELLQEELAGKEMTKENVKDILEDPVKYNSLRNKAVARGIIIGAFNVATGKLASGVGANIMSKSAKATGAVTRGATVKATAAGAGIEAAGGSLGEATARKAIGQEMDISEIALEGVAELPGGIRSTIQARLSKPVYKVNGEKVDKSEVDNLIETMTPDQLAKTKIDIENDYEGVKFRIQDKIVTGQLEKEVRDSNPNASEATINELVALEKELQKFENNKTQSGKDKAASIRSQIKNIQESPEYTINNTKYTKEEFFNQLQGKTQDELKAMNIVVNNDEQTATEIEKLFEVQTLKTEEDAIQKQAAGQVPVQPTTRVGETMEEGKPQAEPKVTTEEGVKEEVTQTIIEPKVVITGTRNGMENLESSNYDQKTDTKIKDARGREQEFGENNVLVEDDGKGNKVINIKADAIDSFGRAGFLQASVIVPADTDVDVDAVKQVVDSEVNRIKEKNNETLRLNEVDPRDLSLMRDAIVNAVKPAPTAAPTAPVSDTRADIERDEQGNFVPKKYTLNARGENPAPNISLSAIKDESFGGEKPTNVKQVKLLEIRGRNSEGVTVGKVWIQLETGESYDAEVFFNDAELDALEEAKPATEATPTASITEATTAETINLEQITKNSYVDRISRNIIEKIGNNWVVKTEVEGKELFKSKTLKGAKEFVSNDNQEALRVQTTDTKADVTPTEVDKIKSDIEASKDRLKKAWDKYKTMGIAFDPKNQLAKDKELVKSLINYAFHNIKLGSYNAAKLIEDLANEGFEITRDGAKFIMDKASKKVQREINKTVGIKPKSTEQKRINKAFSIGVATQKIATEEAKAEVKDLKAQISDLFKAGIEALKIARNTAKNKERAQKEITQNLSKEIKELASTGKITAKQAANIVSAFSKVDVFNQDSIDKFTDYIARVFEKAEYAENISEIKSKLKNAKKNVQTKIGVSQSLTPLMSRLFSIDPTLIPDSVFDKYTELVDMMSERKAVLNLEEYGKVLDKTEEVLDIVNQELSKKEELSEIFNSYEEKVINEEGKIDFNETLKKMLKEELINEDDIDVMKKYKSFILKNSLKEKKSDAEIEQEKQDLLEALDDIDVDSDGLSMKDERNLARELSKLIRTDAVKKLKNTELNNLLRVINNINNGYLPHYTQLIVERLKAKNNSEVLNNAIKKAKPLTVSAVYSKFKSLLTGKDKLNELIRRNPLFYIDQVFGDFKTKDIFNSIFEKAAEAQSMFKKAVNDLTNKLDAAEESVAKSFKYDANKTLMSKFKMMTFMVQLEYESNPNNKRVNPASKYLEKTIEHIKDGKSSFGDRDADMLQEILNKYIDKNGNIDNNKLYDSFNSAEKKAIRTIQNINNEMRDKAIYTASIIRGDKIHPLNNYIHLNVLHEHKPDEALLGAAFIDTYNNSLRPSTKAKSLIERTGKVSPLNFDVFASANRGAKFTLMDYYLTEPIRTARKTLNETSDLLKEEKVSREKKDIFNAIERSFEESVDNLLTNNFMSTSFGDKVASYISQQGYRAMLASIPRFISEFTSNFAFAVITAPKDFAVGIKYRDVVLSSDAANIMDNVKSKQTNRIFSKDTLSGRFIDTSILNQVSGVKGGRAKNDVANKVQQIYNKSGKKYKNFVDIVADSLISTPDKMIMRPVWFGSFANEFKRITGNDIDFDKIASNDEIYMSKNKEAIDAARDFADQKTVFTGAADNAFMGVLKGTSKPNQSALLKGLNMFNSFMTNFLIYEYITARTGVMASIGNGSISKKEGIALLAGVTVRMTMYTVLMNILTEEFARLFSDEEDEDDEKTLLQKIGQGITSSFTSLVLGRDFGNSTKALINYGVERVNEKYLDFLRSGEYDPYKDAIQYTVISPDKKGKQSSFSDMIMNMMGPFGPSMKTAELIFKKITEPEKKKLDAIKRTQKEKAIRIPLEVLGNIGMIPLYKDVRKIVNNEIYKDLRNVKVDVEAQQEKEQIKKEKINALEEVINKSNDRAVRSAAKEMIENMKEDDPEKLEEIKEERKQKKEEKESLLIDERTGIEYDNESDLKKYNKNLWEKNFGEGSEWYRKNKAEKEAEKMMRKIITKEEEEEYDYTPKKKKNKDGSRKRGYENRFTRGYENRFTRD